MVFALIGVQMTPFQVRDAYRRRFGTESSYRQMRQVRIKTNSRNGALRFVYSPWRCSWSTSGSC
jgi:hypothetical protein